MSSTKQKSKHSKKTHPNPDQGNTMAARKAKKKGDKTPASPVKDTHDSTEEESIHEDAVMEDAGSDEDIPDIVDKDRDDDEGPVDDVKGKDTKKSTTASPKKEPRKQKDTKPKPSEPIPFMDTFYQLSSDESPLRSTAARDLLTHCFFSEEGVNNTDAAYALTRLMNGLCSGRAGSRQGFASCLSSFLKVASSSGDDALLGILEQDSLGKSLVGENKEAAEVLRLKLLAATQFQQMEKEAKKAGGKMKGMEERDHVFGRLFGILAVVRSGVLGLKDFPSSVIEGYTSDLIELYNYKNWLREPAANAIIELVSTLDDDAVTSITNDVLLPKFLLATNNKMGANEREQWIRGLNAEQIAVALHLQLLKNVGKFTPPLNKAILTAETVPFIARPLTSTSSVVYPRCHIVWNAMWHHLTEEVDGCRHISKVKGSHAESASIIENLINHVVVKSLLGKGETSGSPSHDRRSLALQIVSMLVGASSPRIVLPPELIKIVLCSDVVERVFLNVMCATGGIGMKRAKAAGDDKEGKNVEHYLKSLTSATLLNMVESCSDGDFLERRTAFAKALVSADPRFDVQTKTQTVSALLMMDNGRKEWTKEEESLQKALWKKYLAFLEEAVITSDTLHKATTYVELMFKLAKRDLLSAAANEARRVIRFFMTAAFFDCSEVSGPLPGKQVQSAKKKKGKKTPSKAEDNAQIPLELTSAIRIKEVLHYNEIESIPASSRAIMSARFYSLLSDFISTINAPSRGGNKSKSFLGNASKTEAVYQALSEISGISSVLELSGAKRFVSESSGTASDDARKHMLDVKNIADDALVKECGNSDDESLRAKSVFATGCAALIISLNLQLWSSGPGEGKMEEDEDDSDDDKEAIHEFISDLSEIVGNFSRALDNQASVDGDEEENPLAALVGLLVNVLSSSVEGDDSSQQNAAMASASKLTRETVKMAWTGVLSLLGSSGFAAKNKFVDEDVMSTLIESVCGTSALKDEKDDDESIDESKEDDNDDHVFANASNMEIELDDQVDESDGKSAEQDESSDDEELDPSKLENMLLEDSDAETDVLEHHAGADKALAQLIKMKQDSRKASQSERERIELCNRLRCASLLDSLFTASVLKSGMLPLEAVLGSFLPILRSYKTIARSLDKPASSSQANKSINEKKSLLDRLASLVDKLSKFRCSDVTDADTELIQKAVSDISEEMMHSLSLAHCSCCSIALVTVIRCIPNVEISSEVASVYSAAIKDWSSRKSTKVHTCVFDDLIQRLPSLATVVLAEPLITSAKDAHSGYLKGESLRLLSLLCRGDKGKSEETLSKAAQTVLNNSCDKIVIVLKESLSDKSLQKAKNHQEVLNAVKHFSNHAKQHTSFISVSSCNDLKEALAAAAKSTKSVGTKNTLTKLADEMSEIAKKASKDSEPKPPKSSSKKKKSKK